MILCVLTTVKLLTFIKFGAAGMLEAPIRSLHFKLIMYAYISKDSRLTVNYI